MTDQNIARLLGLCKDVDKIYSQCRPRRDLVHFSLMQSYHDGTRAYFVNNIDMLSDYFDQELFLSGNTECDPTTYESGFYLANIFNNQAIYHYLESSQQEYYGLYVIYKHLESTDFYYFAANRNDQGLLNYYLNNKDELLNSIVDFNKRAQALLAFGNKYRVKMPFVTSSKRRVSLTKRQQDCASLLRRGMTYKEVARQLDISPKTVEHHIDCLKSKYDALSKSDLIQKLLGASL